MLLAGLSTGLWLPPCGDVLFSADARAARDSGRPRAVAGASPLGGALAAAGVGAAAAGLLTGGLTAAGGLAGEAAAGAAAGAAGVAAGAGAFAGEAELALGFASTAAAVGFAAAGLASAPAMLVRGRLLWSQPQQRLVSAATPPSDGQTNAVEAEVAAFS
jgi:hypothetical protein